MKAKQSTKTKITLNFFEKKSKSFGKVGKKCYICRLWVNGKK